jgi:Cu-processing system permease protein
MPKLLVIASKEIHDGYRNRWIVMMTIVMAALALVLALLGSAPVGTTNISPLAVTVVSLSSLSIFFIPLIALLLSYDAIVGEDERGTLTLLLAHPVSRSTIAIGKFIGQLFILTIVIVIGYGSAALAVSFGADIPLQEQAWPVFLKLLFSSVLLGAVFLALGLLLSIWTKDRGTAAAAAIGLWLAFVVLFDMALLGILSTSGARLINDDVVKWIMLANPADAYRMFNLTANADTAALSGMAGLRGDQGVTDSMLMTLMVAWIVVPLTAACLLFQRRTV